MLRKTLFAPLLAATALTLSIPAHAEGREDRARTAIAAAEAKVHTAESLGTGTAVPEETAEARAALSLAREQFKQDHNTRAIEQAVRAQSLAEAAIGRLEGMKQQAAANDRAAADAQVSAANQQALSAQQQAADANARAASAEQSAAVSASQAQAARDQAALAQQQAAAAQNAQVETTVTTQQTAATAPRRATKTVVKKKATTAARRTAAPTTTTTTTVVKQASTTGM